MKMNNWKEIKNAIDYQNALKRTIEIFDADNNSALSDELDLLLSLVKNYEDEHIHLPEC